MANFLNRLAGRVLGATAVAEPIVPARFSPTASRVGWPAPDRSAWKDGDYSAAVPAASRSFDPETGSHVTGRRRNAALPHEEDEDSQKAVQPEISRSRIEKGTLSFQPRQRDEESSELFTNAVRKLIRHDAQQIPAQATPIPQATSSRQSSSTEILQEPMEGTGSPQPHANVADEVLSGPGKSFRSAAPEAIPRVGKITTPEQAALPSASSVHITIGRVEVRAEIAPPALPAITRRSYPPTLSLEQFLKRSADAR